MSYPPVRQLGTGAQPETEQRRPIGEDGRSRVGRGERGDVVKTTSAGKPVAQVIFGPTEPQRRCTHR
jgi:hypothetical protein